MSLAVWTIALQRIARAVRQPLWLVGLATLSRPFVGLVGLVSAAARNRLCWAVSSQAVRHQRIWLLAGAKKRTLRVG